MALRKKFGGHYYNFDSQFRQEGRAIAQARALRKAGNRARVSRDGDMWIVWVK